MAHPDVSVNYQSLGSGAGIRQLTEGTVDFGASDLPMTDDQMKAMADAKKPKPLHFPTVLGAVVLTYNIPGVTGDLNLTPEAIAGIYLGTVTKWNDPKIASANPGVKLPATDIEVVHRSDGSGTSYIFTDYLSKISPEWKMKVGVNASVSWPLGLGGKGNEGVTGLVKQTPNSIGYVELIYAVQQKMPYANVKNASGKFVKASFTSVTAAAAAAKDMPDDFRVSITNGMGDGVYPISSFTWLLIPSEIKDPAKKKALAEFLAWMLTTGQKDCEGLSYAQLPKAVVAKEQKQIALIK
jgi:phosphate transport system substrate-binding protein